MLGFLHTYRTFKMLSLIPSIVLSLFVYVSSGMAQNLGIITAPAPGTHIAPGAAFNFSYNIRADYCKSSYAYSVYLVTSTPISDFAPTDELMTGHFFGRFDAENYPGTHPFEAHLLCRPPESSLGFSPE